MPNLDKRIAVLESKADSSNRNLKVCLVPVESGESNEQAILRAGHSPDDESKMFVCLVGLEADRQEHR